jgi:hypothetical protein
MRHNIIIASTHEIKWVKGFYRINKKNFRKKKRCVKDDDYIQIRLTDLLDLLCFFSRLGGSYEVV